CDRDRPRGPHVLERGDPGDHDVLIASPRFATRRLAPTRARASRRLRGRATRTPAPSGTALDAPFADEGARLVPPTSSRARARRAHGNAISGASPRLTTSRPLNLPTESRTLEPSKPKGWRRKAHDRAAGALVPPRAWAPRVDALASVRGTSPRALRGRGADGASPRGPVVVEQPARRSRRAALSRRVQRRARRDSSPEARRALPRRGPGGPRRGSGGPRRAERERRRAPAALRLRRSGAPARGAARARAEDALR